MSHLNKEILTTDDFYAYFKPFSIWLIKKKKKKFESLSSDSAHKYFKKFVKKWNTNALKPIFYDIDALLNKYSHLIQTNHQWKFKLSNNDSNLLTKCLTEVKDLNRFSLGPNKEVLPEPKGRNSPLKAPFEEEPKKKIIGPSLPPESLQFLTENERILKQEEEREMEKNKDKLLKKKLKRDAKDLSPKKIGKEAVIDKKRALNRLLNGEKDDDEGGDMGYEPDEGNTFSLAKRREEVRMERKAQKLKEKRDKVNEKILAYQEAENLKMKQLLESLGLDKKYKLKGQGLD